MSGRLVVSAKLTPPLKSIDSFLLAAWIDLADFGILFLVGLFEAMAYRLTSPVLNEPSEIIELD